MQLSNDLKEFRTKWNLNSTNTYTLTSPKVMKNLTVSNAPTLVLYLLPTTKACPAAGTCRKICLNMAGNPAYLNNKIKCRQRRNNAFMQDFNLFLRNLVLESIRFYSKDRDYKKLGLRLNGTSDYSWENVPVTITSNDSDYLLKQFNVYIKPIRYSSILEAILKGLDTKLNQSISTKLIAYDYTKRIDRDWEKCRKLNYHLTLSHGSKFNTLANGTFIGRTFRFRAELSTDDPAQSIELEQLGYTAQLESRTETVNSVIASGTSSKAVTFANTFFTGASGTSVGAGSALPSIGITIENAQSGDFFALSSISGTGFTIDIKNGSSFVDRNFKYTATGFGRGS